MWYIFKSGTCLCHCNAEPDADDLKSRGEVAIENDELFNIADIVLVDGKISKKPAQTPTAQQQYAAINVEYSAKQTALRDAAIDAQLNGKSLDSIIAARTKLSAEWKEKLSAVQDA